MNKFGKVLAVAVLSCAAAGVASCNEKSNSEDTKPAPAASTTAPTNESTSSDAMAPSEAPSTASEDSKSGAATDSSSSSSEPAKTEESSSSAPAASTPAEPEKKSEAAPSSDTQSMAAATPAPASSSTEEKTAAADTGAAADAGASDAGKTYTPEEIAERTSPPDPVSEFAKKEGYKFEDGRYHNKDGDPQPVVTKKFMVDWGTWNGFRRYHDACHVCHGPNAMGSTFAPALKDSLKTMDYGTFIATVSGGKRENRGGTMFVMPAFGTDKNIMCYIDDIYTYIKSRSLWDTSNHEAGMPPGRPAGREDISDEARAAADACTG